MMPTPICGSDWSHTRDVVESDSVQSAVGSWPPSSQSTKTYDSINGKWSKLSLEQQKYQDLSESLLIIIGCLLFIAKEGRAQWHATAGRYGRPLNRTSLAGDTFIKIFWLQIKEWAMDLLDSFMNGEATRLCPSLRELNHLHILTHSFITIDTGQDLTATHLLNGSSKTELSSAIGRLARLFMSQKSQKTNISRRQKQPSRERQLNKNQMRAYKQARMNAHASNPFRSGHRLRYFVTKGGSLES